MCTKVAFYLAVTDPHRHAVCPSAYWVSSIDTKEQAMSSYIMLSGSA